MKFTTFLPQTRNDGTPVPEATITAIVEGWAHRFGGCSVEGTTNGHRIQDGVHYGCRDTSVRVSVVCDNDLYDDARQAVLAVGRQLGQRDMYFEVRDFDGVWSLDVPLEQHAGQGGGNSRRRLTINPSPDRGAL